MLVAVMLLRQLVADLADFAAVAVAVGFVVGDGCWFGSAASALSFFRQLPLAAQGKPLQAMAETQSRLGWMKGSRVQSCGGFRELSMVLGRLLSEC